MIRSVRIDRERYRWLKLAERYADRAYRSRATAAGPGWAAKLKRACERLAELMAEAHGEEAA